MQSCQRSGVAISVICAAMLVGLAPPHARAGTSAPNILVVLSDTHRFDFTGYRTASGENVAPNIQRLKSQGVDFRRAYAPAPLSAPSYATLLSGLAPTVHGVTNNQQSLGKAIPVLPERLAAAGYATAAVIANPYAGRAYGFDRGFEFFWDEVDEHGKEGARVTAVALDWLRQRPPDRPFLLFLAYMDAHAPYSAEYDDDDLLVLFDGEPIRMLEGGNVHVSSAVPLTLAPGDNLIELRRIVEGRADLAPDEQSPLSIFGLSFTSGQIRYRFDSGCENSKAFLRPIANRVVLRATNPTDAPVDTTLLFRTQRGYGEEEYRRFYAAGVREFDHELGRLMGFLKTSGLADDTILVFVSDHGEMLGEHDAWGHAYNIEEETMHVPLVIRAAGLPAGAQSAALFPLESLPATLLGLAGLDAPTDAAAPSRLRVPESNPGLLAWFADAGPGDPPFEGADSIVFATYPPEGSTLRVGVLRWPLKLTLAADTDAVALFDLAKDPSEQIDLYPARRREPRVVEMLGQARSHVAATLDTEALDLDALSPDQINQLRALGYLE